MKYTFKKLALTVSALAVVSSVFSTLPAQAKITTMKMHYVQGQFANPPTIVMRHNGEVWQWTNQNDFFQIQAKVKLKATVNRITGAFISFGNKVIWGTPGNSRFYKLEKLVNITLNKNNMGFLVPSAGNLCKKFGGISRVVKPMPSTSKLVADYETGKPSITVGLPVRVVCEAKTNPPSVPVPLKVTKLKLYTVPQKPTCGRPVILITEVHTNKPGKVNFKLYRRDGNIQNASLTTRKAGNGYVKRWSKTYTLNKSTKREYMVVLMGHPFSTNWTPIEVKCGAKANQRPGGLIKN